MGDKFDFQFDGYDDLRTLLNNLEVLVEKKEITEGEKAAARYLITKGRERLKTRLKKSHSNNLMRSFTYRMRKKNAGVLVGFKRPEGSAAHLVDKGTKDRITARGANRGSITGNNFWSDTRTNDSDKAMEIMMNAIEASIDKILLR